VRRRPVCHNVRSRIANLWVRPILADFAYSPAVKANGITWNDTTLTDYLRDPRVFIPDSGMAFPGTKDDQELADLLAYLKQATK
jgi:cytochrome c